MSQFDFHNSVLANDSSALFIGLYDLLVEIIGCVFGTKISSLIVKLSLH